ncbi:MAG: hypothetical protein ACRC62_28930 [Microcoleus sp.]
MSLVNPISIQLPPEMDNSTKFTRPVAVSLVANTSTVLATANDNRTGFVMRNPGAFDVYLCLSDVATAASAIAVLEPNGFYELAPADYNGAVSVICPAGAGAIAGSEMASVSFDPDSDRVGTDIGNGVFFSLFNGLLKRKEGAAWVDVDFSVTAAKYRNGRVVYLVDGNLNQPKISQSSNGWVPSLTGANDWSPDEDNSPSVPA